MNRAPDVLGDNEEMKRVRAIVTGTVQGVGYRYTLREAARAEGVTGWVRNRRDGSVEAELEGTPEAIERVLEGMRSGPPGARVDAVTVDERHPEGTSDFSIAQTR